MMGARLATVDFLNALRKDINFLEVTSRYTHGRFDIDEPFIQGTADTFVVTLRTFDADPFVYGKLDSVEFLLDADGDARPIFLTVDDAEPIVIDWHPKRGYNRLPIDISFTDKLVIEYDMGGLFYAPYDGYPGNYCRCTYDIAGCANCLNVIVDDANVISQIGIVLNTSCHGDTCELVKTFSSEMAMPILYRSGAFFLEELLATNRVNPYVRGGKETAEVLLQRWMGRINPITAQWEAGEYQKMINQVVAGAVSLLRQVQSSAITQNRVQLRHFIP